MNESEALRFAARQLEEHRDWEGDALYQGAAQEMAQLLRDKAMERES